MADIRINEIVTDLNVTDASSILTPAVMEKLVHAVLQRLEEKKTTEMEIDEERNLGAMRTNNTHRM